MNTTSRLLAASLSMVIVATWNPAHACTERSRISQTEKSGLAYELLKTAGPRIGSGLAWAGIGAGLGGTLAGSVTKLLGGDYEDGFATGAALGSAAGFATGLIYNLEAAAPTADPEASALGNFQPTNL